MYCGKCGVKNSDDVKFCSGCGSQLGTGAVVMKEVVMEKYFFMKSVLQLISQGEFFRNAFAAALRILAGVVIIFGLVVWISVWKFVSRAPLEAILGIIIFQLLFVIAIYMVVHTLFIRARDIAELPEADFTVIPIASISLKLIGEIYACFATVISVAGGILIWFAGGYAHSLIEESTPLVPSFGGGQGFLGGLLFIASGLLVAFLVLVLFYFLSELVGVLADIAKNIKITRQIAEQYGRSKKNP